MVGLWPIGALSALAALSAPPEHAKGADAQPNSQHEMRTRILPGNGYIRYEVLPGDDEEPPGELIVVHVDERAPSPPPQALPAEEPQPRRQARRDDHCSAERGKLVARLFELRGIQIDPDFAEWLEQNLTIGNRAMTSVQIDGEPLLVTAVKTDAVARSLAEDLSRCERVWR